MVIPNRNSENPFSRSLLNIPHNDKCFIWNPKCIYILWNVRVRIFCTMSFSFLFFMKPMNVRVIFHHYEPKLNSFCNFKCRIQY
jgi:hypothetical protein